MHANCISHFSSTYHKTWKLASRFPPPLHSLEYMFSHNNFHRVRLQLLMTLSVLLVVERCADRSNVLQQRPHHPVRPIPSQLWCKNFGKKEYWRMSELARRTPVFILFCHNLFSAINAWRSMLLHTLDASCNSFDLYYVIQGVCLLVTQNKLVTYKPLMDLL